MNSIHPSWFDWLTVLAIAIGPILALSAQRALDHIREKQKKRVEVYSTLMATRAALLSPPHVQALNSIDVVFNRPKDRRIREAWKAVLDHLALDPQPPNWSDRLADLRVDLLREIGLAVGYDFGADYLKRQIYAPKFYEDLELDQIKIRKALVTALTDAGLNVVVHEPAPNPAAPPPPAGGPPFGSRHEP